MLALPLMLHVPRAFGRIRGKTFVFRQNPSLQPEILTAR
jgi:hypothetical protein